MIIQLLSFLMLLGCLALSVWALRWASRDPNPRSRAVYDEIWRGFR